MDPSISQIKEAKVTPMKSESSFDQTEPSLNQTDPSFDQIDSQNNDYISNYKTNQIRMIDNQDYNVCNNNEQFSKEELDSKSYNDELFNREFNSEQINRGHLHRDQFTSEKQFTKDSVSRETFCKEQFLKEPYNKDEYTKDQYSKGQHAKDQYGKDQYGNNQYVKDQYSKDQHVKDQYKDHFTKDHFTKDQFTKEQFDSIPNEKTALENHNQYNTNSADYQLESGKSSLELTDTHPKQPPPYHIAAAYSKNAKFFNKIDNQLPSPVEKPVKFTQELKQNLCTPQPLNLTRMKNEIEEVYLKQQIEDIKDVDVLGNHLNLQKYQMGNKEQNFVLEQEGGKMPKLMRVVLTPCCYVLGFSVIYNEHVSIYFFSSRKNRLQNFYLISGGVCK